MGIGREGRHMLFILLPRRHQTHCSIQGLQADHSFGLELVKLTAFVVDLLTAFQVIHRLEWHQSAVKYDENDA